MRRRWSRVGGLGRRRPDPPAADVAHLLHRRRRGRVRGRRRRPAARQRPPQRCARGPALAPVGPGAQRRPAAAAGQQERRPAGPGAAPGARGLGSADVITVINSVNSNIFIVFIERAGADFVLGVAGGLCHHTRWPINSFFLVFVEWSADCLLAFAQGPEVIAAHFSLVTCMSHLLTPVHVACVHGCCCMCMCVCVCVCV